MSNGSRRNIGIARGIRIFLFLTIQRPTALIRSLYTADRYYPSMFYLYFTNPPILSSMPRQRECRIRCFEVNRLSCAFLYNRASNRQLKSDLFVNQSTRLPYFRFAEA
jgi:hypothetical protein